MLTIHLNNVPFFAYHGLYPAEKEKGNQFIVNLTIQYTPAKKIVNIEDTINYATVYELVSQRMAIATPLLETVVMEIAQTILTNFPLAMIVDIQLDKHNPPILNFGGTVGVSYHLTRLMNQL